VASLYIQGRSASPGFAVGPVAVLSSGAGMRQATGDANQEARALTAAITDAINDIRALQSSLTGDAADMLAFQIAMLDDPALAEDAFAAIGKGEPADRAWTSALDAEIAGYRSSDDEYFRARASDLADMRDRVLAHLTGAGQLKIPSGAIVLADDITPSQFLSTSWTDGGIVLRHGSSNSHVGMLARARGVPMIVGVGASASIAEGTLALLDGERGHVIAEPDAGERQAFEQRRAEAVTTSQAVAAVADKPAVTADGRAITILLNISDPAELVSLDPRICDGIGLVRTELLFEGRALPDEATQTAVYTRIVQWANGRPVTIRTLDAGGDKPIAGLTPVGETNPFLGVRGVRLTLRHPKVFKTQLRALARSATAGNLEIMVPMVSSPSEISATRALLDEACAELVAEGLPHRRPPLGIMVEVPAVAISPERYDADFYSIGSNDLVQYTLAAGRDVSALADLAVASDPAVLRLIENVVENGRARGRKVSICGDAAGDPALIPLLLERGLTQLSMAPSQVGRAKLAIAAAGRVG
jgi:phosphoenolpyruvate-protein phosphotransferase (PTS system enzyme I)